MENAKSLPTTSTELAQGNYMLASATAEGNDMKVPKRSISQMIGASVSLLAAAQIFIACQPNSGSGGGTPAPVVNPAPHLGGSGTGDSAGGDGINNKVFEKYAVPDIRKTPEWITHVEPIEKHLASLPKLRNVDANLMLSVLARTKRWFIAPISLEQIEKSALGVEFIKDPIQQLALQSDKSVWIDDRLYNMSTDSDAKKNNSDLDRATLLMHEMMVSLYLVRFLPAEDLCRQFTENPSGCSIAAVTSLIGAPEPRRKLEKIDYERIRSMTAWMMNNAIHIASQRDLFVELYRHSFDPRLFKADPEAGIGPIESEASNEQLPPMKMDFLYQGHALASAKSLGRLATNCAIDMPNFVNGQCDVNVDLKIIPGVSNMLQVSFKVQANGRTREFVAHRLTDNNPINVEIYRRSSIIDRGELIVEQNLGFAFPVGVDTLTVGQDIYEVTIGWAEDRQTVKQILLSQRRVTSVSNVRPTEYRGYVGTENTFGYGTPHEDQRRDILIVDEKNAHGKTGVSSASSTASSNHVSMLNPQLAPVVAKP